MKHRHGLVEHSFFFFALFLVCVGFYFSIFAGLAVILGILSQCVWTVILQDYEKKQEDLKDDPAPSINEKWLDHFDGRLDFYANRHPTLIVRQLATVALMYKTRLDQELESKK